MRIGEKKVKNVKKKKGDETCEQWKKGEKGSEKGMKKE